MKKKVETTHIRIPKYLKEKLKVEAAKKRVSMLELVEEKLCDKK